VGDRFIIALGQEKEKKSGKLKNFKGECTKGCVCVTVDKVPGKKETREVKTSRDSQVMGPVDAFRGERSQEGSCGTGKCLRGDREKSGGATGRGPN